jgi:hypothetical protein
LLAQGQHNHDHALGYSGADKLVNWKISESKSQKNFKTGRFPNPNHKKSQEIDGMEMAILTDHGP